MYLQTFLSYFYFLFLQVCVLPKKKKKILMNWRATDIYAAVLFVLTWLASSFNGNLNKLLNTTMKLHLNIQCQCEGLPRIPFKPQIQPASLSFRGLLHGIISMWDWPWRLPRFRDHQQQARNTLAALSCVKPPSSHGSRGIDRERPHYTAALLATEMSGDRFKVQFRSVVFEINIRLKRFRRSQNTC